MTMTSLIWARGRKSRMMLCVLRAWREGQWASPDDDDDVVVGGAHDAVNAANDDVSSHALFFGHP